MADTGTARVAADMEEDEPNSSVFRVNSKTLLASVSKLNSLHFKDFMWPKMAY